MLTIEDLRVEFKTAHGVVQAVTDVTFEVRRGETLSIVGESGSGKSTIAKSILRLIPEASGRILFEDVDVLTLSRSELRNIRPELQMIFQDPLASLNPRLKVHDIVAEGLRIWPDRASGSIDATVDGLLKSVGLSADLVKDRRAGEFSGGQCQRMAIARAVALRPKMLICDEAVSALDVSVQAQILNLLRDMKTQYELTLLFISHNLGVVKNVSDRVLVMYLGKVCEVAATDDLFSTPAHPYTQLLLDSVPHTGGDGIVVPRDAAQDEFPSPLAPPSGCRFRTRCPLATERCAQEEPALRELADGRRVACHFAENAQASYRSRLAAAASSWPADTRSTNAATTEHGSAPGLRNHRSPTP
jgi:peptide/nickel transport system ATP-binding protein